YHVGQAQAIDPINKPNQFDALTIPGPASAVPLNTTLGISDFGPYPTNMTHRNDFRGPGAWNVDMALDKKFPITSTVGMEFRAEGYDVLNHHNFYANTTGLAFFGVAPSIVVPEEKGGLGSLATGGNHDERRFGQFSLKLFF
ncbi:MAG: hypothetical protein WAK26_11860, partial [Terracidiphilus sp.]